MIRTKCTLILHYYQISVYLMMFELYLQQNCFIVNQDGAGQNVYNSSSLQLLLGCSHSVLFQSYVIVVVDKYECVFSEPTFTRIYSKADICNECLQIVSSSMQRTRCTTRLAGTSKRISTNCGCRMGSCSNYIVLLLYLFMLSLMLLACF